MFESLYIYSVLLGCTYVYKTLSNDPERDKIWGTGSKDLQLSQKEKEIELLKSQLEHYKTYNPLSEKLPRMDSNHDNEIQNLVSYH
jgi:hypothetical protein